MDNLLSYLCNLGVPYLSVISHAVYPRFYQFDGLTKIFIHLSLSLDKHFHKNFSVWLLWRRLHRWIV